jgi:hypothetical protein
MSERISQHLFRLAAGVSAATKRPLPRISTRIQHWRYRCLKIHNRALKCHDCKWKTYTFATRSSRVGGDSGTSNSLEVAVSSARLSIKRCSGRPVCGRNRKMSKDGFLAFVETAFTSGKRLRFVILPSHLSGGTQLSPSVAVYGETQVVSVVTVADGNRHGIGRQLTGYQILADTSTRTTEALVTSLLNRNWRLMGFQQNMLNKMSIMLGAWKRPYLRLAILPRTLLCGLLRLSRVFRCHWMRRSLLLIVGLLNNGGTFHRYLQFICTAIEGIKGLALR